MYLVIEMNPHVPVYTIKPETGSKPVKKVHRNNLMNCNFLLPKMSDNSGCHKTVNTDCNRASQSLKEHNEIEGNEADEDEDELVLIKTTVWED